MLYITICNYGGIRRDIYKDIIAIDGAIYTACQLKAAIGGRVTDHRFALSRTSPPRGVVNTCSSSGCSGQLCQTFHIIEHRIVIYIFYDFLVGLRKRKPDSPKISSSSNYFHLKIRLVTHSDRVFRHCARRSTEKIIIVTTTTAVRLS
jgi:hypothetical protein